MVDGYSHEQSSDLTRAVPRSIEESAVFRLAELTMLLEEASVHSKKVNSIDRIGYYDFFVAHPFALVEREGSKDSSDRIALNAAGFSSRQLSYGSIGSRYVRRRKLLPLDLEILLSHGLATISNSGFSLTKIGFGFSSALSTSHADAYRIAAGIVIRRLSRLSDSALNSTARQALGNSWLLIDFTDDVQETEISGMKEPND